jgi:hypothetical protein
MVFDFRIRLKIHPQILFDQLSLKPSGAWLVKVLRDDIPYPSGPVAPGYPCESLSIDVAQLQHHVKTTTTPERRPISSC